MHLPIPLRVLARGRATGSALPNTRTVSGLTDDSAVLNGVYFPSGVDLWASENGGSIFVESGVWYVQNATHTIYSQLNTEPNPESVATWILSSETGTPVVTRP